MGHGEKPAEEPGGSFPSRRQVLGLTAAGLGAMVLKACAPEKTAESAAGAQAQVLVRPRLEDGPLNNPWMGWGLWAGPIYFDGSRRTIQQNTTAFGDNAPLFDWVLLDWMWADLEPAEGQFRWDELDEIIDFWKQRGKQICLRPWVTDDPGWNGAPGASQVCPDWVYAAGLKWRAYKGEGGVDKREPDYADPSFQSVFMPRLKNFLAALAERYDKPVNPFAVLGCMGYGQWGEWHTMWSDYHWPDKKTKHEVLAGIVNLYADTFKNMDISISYCFDTFNFGQPLPPEQGRKISFRERVSRDDPRDFMYRQALDVALQRGFLLARHGFIDGLWYTDKKIMQREWTRTALMAEGDWSYLDMKNHRTHGTVDENIDVMLEWHSNYGHFYVDAESYRRLVTEDAARFERGLKAGGLGYRLVLESSAWPEVLAPGCLLVLKQTWENRNAGRCYRRHPLKLYLTDKAGKEAFSETDFSFDQTGWVRGTRQELYSVFHLPKDIPEGSYDLRIAMVDREGRPALKLGIQGKDNENRYLLGTLKIDKKAASA